MRLIVAFLVFFAAAPALAVSGKVVLLELGASFSDEAWPAAEVRTEAELTAVGFEVVRVSGVAREDVERREELESAAAKQDAVAALSIRRVTRDRAVEFWIADSVTGKISVRRVPSRQLQSPDAASLTGLHIVELLRASLLELQIMPPERAKAAPPVVQKLVELPQATSSEPGPSRISVGVAAAGAVTQGGLGPTLGPLVRLRLRLVSRLGLDVEASTSILQRRLEREGVRASVDAALARGRFWLEPWSSSRWSFIVGVDGGVLFLRTSGLANDALVARDADALVFMPGLTMGATWHFSRAAALALTVGASAPLERVRVRFGDAQVARLGAVWADASVGLMVAL